MIERQVVRRLHLADVEFPSQLERAGLISCLLGGGQCQYSNVMMAEARARLATGMRVFARLEDGPAPPPERLPAPLGNAGRRDANLILPMQDVGEEGTAESPAGFLYMEKSKVKNPPGRVVADGDMKKFRFAAPFINHLLTHLATASEERQGRGH